MRGGHGGRDTIEGRLKRLLDLSRLVGRHHEYRWRLQYLSHANWAQAYGRAISSSDLRELATLRDRASSESVRSTNSGGRGPFNAGTRLVKACSTLALLIVVMLRFGCGVVRCDAIF